jgi:hypothetical protein
VNYLQEKVARLQALQVDLEATKVELKRQSQDFTRQQAAQPPGNDDDARTGAPSTLRFPRVSYNMVAATYRLEDIFEMSDTKTNERLHKVRWLLRFTLEQQAKNSTSLCRAMLSRTS